jgi:hypothetical protein
MADKRTRPDNSGYIYTEFDYNNIIIVDPNKTVDDKGVISERLVDHENMVMYANLEAELLPRTKLAIGSSPDNIRTISIAKINFLKPANDDYFTTNYYDEITGENTTIKKGQNQTQTEYVPPSNGQRGYNKLSTFSDGKEGTIDNGLLGITSINVKVSGSFIPTVTMTLEDVQGRALFQLGENSPYAAFFHLPYPPFYLTIKGYYGQAVKYQLNLEKFDCNFNSIGGNYMINLTFQGYKFNILNEISMGSLLAAPHMYSSRFDISNSNVGSNPSQSQQAAASQQSANIAQPSNSNGVVTKQMFVEKGYQKIIEVYNEYKSKKIIPKDFPELTLQQLMNKLETFEQTILNNYKKSDVEPLTNIRQYQQKLKEYYEVVISDATSWFNTYLNPKPFIGLNGIKYYAYLNDITDDNKPNALSKLEGYIKNYNEVLASNKTLGKDGTSPITNGITISTITATTTQFDINWEKTYTEQYGISNPTAVQIEQFKTSESISNLFKPLSFGSVTDGFVGPQQPGTTFITDENKKNSLELLKPYFFIFDGTDRFIGMINNMNAEASKKLSEIETKLSESLREKIEDSKTGLGFKPTVRNIIAIIMASAEGFIRLMDDVHTKAWDVKYDPVRKNAILNNTSSAPGVDTKQVVQNTIENASNTTSLQTPVYPWPQFFVEEMGDDRKPKFQLKYIADPSIVDRTMGYVYDKWPEVEFVEEYIKGLTQRFTPPNTPTPSSEQDFTNFLNINAIEFPQSDVAYTNTEEIKFFFELWERQFMTSRYENLGRIKTTDTDYENIKNLIVDVDTKNILTSLGGSNPYLNFKLKNFQYTAANYVEFLKSITKNGQTQTYYDFTNDVFVTPYIKNLTANPNLLLSIKNVGKEPVSKLDGAKLESIVKSTQTNEPIIIDTYPFTNSSWDDSNLVDRSNSQGNSIYNTTKSLKFYKQRNLITNYLDLNDFKTNRPVTNFSYLTIQNPLSNSQLYQPTNQTQFFINLYYNRTPKNFIPTEGNCYFNTPTNKTVTFFGTTTNKLPIKTTTSILNTPMFINSIIDGVNKCKQNNETPFVTSAYLFLNSLPLISLREKYKTQGTNLNELDYMFATIKKFGALHKLPYAWILKFGSIWHRYKTYVETGTDILTSVWKDVDYKNAFDPVTNSASKKYILDFNGGTGKTIQLESINFIASSMQIGFYPKLIDDFNYMYKGSILYNGYTDSDIQTSINNGLKLYNFTQSNANYIQNSAPLNLTTWSSLLPSDDGSYLILPSFGGSQNQITPSLTESNVVVAGASVDGNPAVYNGSMRLLWASPNYGYFDRSQIAQPASSSYLNNIKDTSDLLSPFILSNSTNYSRIDDLFGVFDKTILDSFEVEFKNFSKSMTNLTSDSPILKYDSPTGDPDRFLKNFQLLFKTLMTVPAPSPNETTEMFFGNAITNQLNNFSNVIQKFLEYDVILKIGNPSYYDRKTFDSYLLYNPTSTTTNKNPNIYLQYPDGFEPYVAGSLPTNQGTVTLLQSKQQLPNEWKDLELYVGFSTIPGLVYSNNGSYITDFFKDNNIKFTSNNIKKLAPIIKMYATQKLNNSSLTASTFKTSLNTYFNDCVTLQNNILDGILTGIRKNLPNYQEVPEAKVSSRIDGQQTKVNLYETFKALNDKWIAGGDYKTKTFFEDILFLDKASRNIGDILYLDIFSLKDILNEKEFNQSMSVYTFIAGLLIRNNFIIMNLPAYVNFYNIQNVDGVSKPVIKNSLDFANDMWGTHLTVDTRESGPKMVCFFVAKPSSYLDLEESKNFLFRSDGIQLEKRGAANPLSEDWTKKDDRDYGLSNRCVGFTVDIGIRNQNVFSSFQVSQANGKATTESVSTLYNMIQQASGRQVSTQNVSLYNYYANRSYGAQVVCLGNAMIQPTMYFNLRHVPMFNGPYMITDVSHVITPGSFQTTFNGTRQGVYDLPSIDNFLQSINQNLLTKLEDAVLSKDDGTTTNTTSNASNVANSTTNAENTKAAENSCVDKVLKVYKDKGFVSSGATETKLNEKQLTDIIKAQTSDTNTQAIILALCYVRTYKLNVFQGFDNNFAMISLKQNYSSTSDGFFEKSYCCVNSETTSSTESIPIARFKTPELFVGFIFARIKDRVRQITITPGIGLLEFYVTTWQDNQIDSATFETNRNSVYKDLRDRLVAVLEGVGKRNGINVTNITELVDGKKYTQNNSTPTPTPTPTPTATPPSGLGTFPPQQITLRNLGSSPTLQGYQWSYFNIKKLTGGYLTFQIITPEPFDVHKIYDFTFVDAATNNTVSGVNNSGGIDTNYTYETIIGRAGQFKLVVRYLPYGWSYPSGGQLLIQTITSEIFTL